MLLPVALRGRVFLCFAHAALLKKKSQQSSFTSQSIQCNSSIIPCAQSGRRTWTVDKWHNKKNTGAKWAANTVAHYSERLVVACLGDWSWCA